MENKPVFVLLAGGKSERMGVAKGLLKYQHTFWILEQLHRVSKSSIQDVVIGLGFNFQHYFEAIPWLQEALVKTVAYQHLNIRVVINQKPELGSFSTLKTVLMSLTSEKAIVINPIDVPLLNSEELEKIISENNQIVIPNYQGKNGHPIKLKYTFWKKLIDLDLNDSTARLDLQIKNEAATHITKIEVFDKHITLNLNTKKAWLSFVNEGT